MNANLWYFPAMDEQRQAQQFQQAFLKRMGGGLHEQGAFFAHHQDVVGAHIARGQSQRRKGRLQGVVVTDAG